jgi:hypothetical protein
MKKHLRHLMLTVLLGGLLASQSAFAGACCDKTAKATKAGKTCAACETQTCCKKAAQQAADSGKVKPCKKCAAKKKDACADAPKTVACATQSKPGDLAWPGF